MLSELDDLLSEIEGEMSEKPQQAAPAGLPVPFNTPMPPEENKMKFDIYQENAKNGSWGSPSSGFPKANKENGVFKAKSTKPTPFPYFSNNYKADDFKENILEHKRSQDAEDIDDFLKEVMDEEVPSIHKSRSFVDISPKKSDKLYKPTKSTFNSKNVDFPKQSNGKKIKCYPLFIGGASLQEGMTSSSFNQFSCNKLRCLRCDHLIERYSGWKWKDSCDYLFFRNYIKNIPFLKSGLERAHNFSAYACQCEWKSLDSPIQLSASSIHNKWVCGGHSG